MSNDKWFGIPREEIDWFPTVDYEKCVGCMACIEKCNMGVYAKEKGKPKVVKPKNCIVGCAGCDEVCPEGAISHPPKKYLTDLIKKKNASSGCNCACGGNCK